MRLWEAGETLQWSRALEQDHQDSSLSFLTLWVPLPLWVTEWLSFHLNKTNHKKSIYLAGSWSCSQTLLQFRIIWGILKRYSCLVPTSRPSDLIAVEEMTGLIFIKCLEGYLTYSKHLIHVNYDRSFIINHFANYYTWSLTFCPSS